MARRRRVDDAEVLDQPLHVGAGRQHDRLGAPRQLAVARPGDDRVGAVGRPPVRRRRRRPGAQVEHPARSERDLGLAAAHASLTDERRLLVADEGGDRRCAGQRRRLADDAAGVDDARQHRHGMPKAAARSSFQPAGSPPQRPVTAALVWSVTCTSPPVSVHANQRVDGAEAEIPIAGSGTLASSQASLVIDWFGASETPCSALAVMQSNTVRRSCQPIPGRSVRPSPGPTRSCSPAGW